MRPPTRAIPAAVTMLIAGAWLAAPAAAQGMQSPAQWYINQNLYSTRVFNGVIANSMLDASRGTKTGAAGAPGAASGDAGRDVTRFAPAATRLAPARFAKRSATTPEARRAAQAEYDAHVDLYEKTAGNDGFPADDLAYAYEYFVVNSYQVHHNLVSLPLERDPYLRNAIDGFDRIALAGRKRAEQVTPQQERAIYEQFRAQLGASAEVQRMTDAEKQEAAEMLAITFGVTYAAYLRGVDSGDAALIDEARRAAQTGLEKMLGRPMEKIRVSARGLEP